jgi:oxygen-independent coproporphyrinogen-3 oxidase
VEKTIAMKPESVTIYQMELPYNTVFSKVLRDEEAAGKSAAVPTSLPVVEENADSNRGPHPSEIADWPTKRAWVDYAFNEFRKAGYDQSSAYTVVKNNDLTKFVYRDALWRGADMLGTGVASFGHMNGVHIQNLDTWEQYLSALDAGKLPLGRAFPTTPRDRQIREMILQLKTGSLRETVG